jgi:glycosyltransferase involved in cell wall biosynthesis
MRILHAVLSEGFYGSERYCGELAVEQARRGHEVEVVTLGTASDCTRVLRAAIAQERARSGDRLRLVTIPRLVPAALHRAFARATLRRFRPQIVHTHLDPAARRFGCVAQRLGIPHVATLHLNFSAPEYGACDGLILIADWQRKILPAHFAGAVAVIRNWLPAAVGSALSHLTFDAIAALRRTWGADEQTFVYGSVGRLVSEKGMDMLIRGFRRAFPLGDTSVRLVIVGDGPDRQALQELAAGDTRIVLPGAQREVATFYRAFDAYVSAARFEPFGIAILEAMAAACPLILARSQGPAEFVTDARVQWVDEQTDTALAKALVATQEVGRRRLAYALEDFSPQRAATEVEHFYARVIQAKAG